MENFLRPGEQKIPLILAGTQLTLIRQLPTVIQCQQVIMDIVLQQMQQQAELEQAELGLPQIILVMELKLSMEILAER
jgi:hypothetical protein